MFCRHCGYELSDDSQFCSKCGRKVDAHAAVPAKKNEREMTLDNSHFNRDVLLTYLYQLQVMEFSVNELTQDLNKLDREINGLGHSYAPATPYKDSVDLGAIGSFLFLGALCAVIGSFLYSIIPVGLFSFARTVGIIIIIGTILIGFISAASKSSENDERQAKYRKALEEDATRVNREKIIKNNLLAERPKYTDRLKQAKDILIRAYSVNVIPDQFRNIYAIYYLYNYLSTSQSNLESAMLHFDLNEIKSKLDTVIAQQRQIILQNAQQLAQNSVIMEQNEDLVKHAIATERNTARAAQYAEIAATNTEVTAFTNTVMASVMVSKL